MIYCLLFSLLYSKWVGNCAAILGQYKYNLTSLVNQPIIKYQHESNYYYMRLCSEPSLESTSDVFVLRCSSNSNTCYPIATRYNVNYTPVNPQNFSEGIIYYTNDEIYYDNDDGAYKELSLKLELKCKDTQDGINDVSITINESSTEIINVKAYSSAACPIIVPSPTPTPSYQPHCIFSSRMKSNITFGINGNFMNLNHFPFGMTVDVVVDGKPKLLFYQPCERISCPPSFSCSNDGFSSAWLCEINGLNRSCDSYGITDDSNILPVDLSNLEKGILFNLKDKISHKNINITLHCESDFHEGKIKWENNASISQDTLLLTGSTPEVCIKVIPTPKPIPPESCQFKSIETAENKIDLNLGSLNNGDIGWKKTVKVNTESSNIESTLIYQPCGPIFCPPDSYCNGDEDAYIWLCNGENCIGYGLYQNNISFSAEIQKTSGIHVTYKGSQGRSADIIYMCNKTLDEGSISLPDEVTINDDQLSFQIKSKQACASTTVVETPTEEITSFITEETSTSNIFSDEPTISNVITDQPTISNIITKQPSSSITPTSHVVITTEIVSTTTNDNDDLPITSAPNNTVVDNESSNTNKESRKKIWIIIIPVIIGIPLFLYFVIGTTVVSIRDKSCHLPNRKFWRKCSKCCSKKEKEFTFKLISDSD